MLHKMATHHEEMAKVYREKADAATGSMAWMWIQKAKHHDAKAEACMNPHDEDPRADMTPEDE